MKLSQIGNNIRGCKTPGCDGNLAVKSTGMGGGLSVCFGCDGCKVKLALFTRYENEPAYNNDISVSVQVAFILAGSTHTTYCKTLQNALGMKTVNANVFYETMYPVVKAMLDDLCEVAKREMKEKNDGDLGSWKRAVTTADGTWQTRGWHSKNATFTIRNYLNGALLYYHHLCQKGRDKIVEGDFYLGTSKSAEGYAARITFQRAGWTLPFIGRTLTPPPPRLSGRYTPRLKSCCVVVMLVEHIEKFWKNVRKIKFYQY